MVIVYNSARFGATLGRWRPAVAEWALERIERVPDDGRPANAWVTTRELYEDYSNWKLKQYEFPVDIRRWGMAMKALGFQSKNSGASRYVGVRLVSARKGQSMTGNDSDTIRFSHRKVRCLCGENRKEWAQWENRETGFDFPREGGNRRGGV